MEEKYLSVKEASIELKLSVQYVRKLLDLKKITGKKIGKIWIVTLKNIKLYKMRKNAKITISDRVSKVKIQKKPLKALSFFSGAMGLDIGLHKTDIQTLLACEIDKASRMTITENEPDIGLIGDIMEFSADEIIEYAGLKDKNEVDIIVGGPPCQAFSTAGKRLGFADERGNVFLKYLEIIEDIKPKYAVIENVRGLLYSSIDIDLPERDAVIFPEEMKGKKGSTLYYVYKFLERIGYKVTFNLYNSANYGSPQIRERVIITCSLEGEKMPFLQPTSNEIGSNGMKEWLTLRDAVGDLDSNEAEHINFPEKRLKYYKHLTAGQNWKNLSIEMQKEAMGKSYYLQGGKTGFFRRLSWERPSPTIVTHPAMPATDLAHPEEDRPLSVQEYKRLQEFPDEWILCGNTLDKYKQIGNAVPVSLGLAIGISIQNHINGIEVKNPLNFPYSRYKKTSDIEFIRRFENSIVQFEENKNQLNLFPVK